MKITILTENQAGSQFLAEHGLSYLIEIDEEKVLFDAGHSDVFIKNAAKLSIDIKAEVNQIVLSHGHWDHGNGFQFLTNKTLITHPRSFVKRFRKKDGTPVGLSNTQKWFDKNFQLNLNKAPHQISKHLYFLGEIPRLNNFESKTTPFALADGLDDFVMDDSALLAIKNNELIIISGCAHSGICNICEYAKKLTGINTIKAVIGGFHLKHQDVQSTQTISYFKTNKVETLLPSHCTDLPALSLFYKAFKIQPVKTGMVFRF